MPFEAIKHSYHSSPEFFQSNHLTEDVLLSCEQILTQLDFHRQEQLDKSVTALSAISVPLEVIDKGENLNV